MTKTEIENYLVGENPKLILESNCYGKENQVYFKPFTLEERAEAQETFLKESIDIATLEEKFAIVKADHKAQVTPKVLQVKELRTQLKNNGKEQQGDVYSIDDQENDLMHYYTENGEYLRSRKLMQSERQLHINHLKVKTSNE